MYDADAIEAINFEQLVTVTDRLLLRRGRVPKRRPSTNRIGPSLEASVSELDDRTVIIHRPRVIVSTRAIAISGALLTIALFIAALA